MRFICPCCGNFTFEADNEDDLEFAFFCGVCKWMYEPAYHIHIDAVGGNHITLREAQKNYKKYGYSDVAMKDYCRPPREEELPENNN